MWLMHPARGKDTELTPAAIAQRAKAERIGRILDAFHGAKDGMTLSAWCAMSGDAEWRKLAAAVEPLLREAEDDSSP